MKIDISKIVNLFFFIIFLLILIEYIIMKVLPSDATLTMLFNFAIAANVCTWYIKYKKTKIKK